MSKVFNGVKIYIYNASYDLGMRNRKAGLVYDNTNFTFYANTNFNYKPAFSLEDAIFYVVDNDDTAETVIELGKGLGAVEKFLMQFYDETRDADVTEDLWNWLESRD